jgi:TM2 domain-containing membrane protein YozV
MKIVNHYSKIIGISILLSIASICNQQVFTQDTIPLIPGNNFLNERFAHIDLMFDNNYQFERKNPGLAVLFSLVIPGTGEWYAGNISTGKYFLGSELTLWLSVYGFYSYGSWLKNDAKSFARVQAGVDWSDKDDQFFVNVGNFISREEYNEKKMRDRDIRALYTDASYEWTWETDEMRREFRELRVRSDKMFNAIKFVGVAIVANHIASAVIAGYSARQYNENLKNAANARWSFGILPLQNGFVAGIQHTF